MKQQDGILIVLSSQRLADEYQKHFDRKEIHFVGVGGAMTGYRFRAVFVATEAYINSIRNSEVALRNFQEYLDYIRCRLAPGCTDNFFII